jgi:CrcB protein
MSGGAAGALARYAVALLSAQLRISAVWAILAVNISGSFALGFLLALLITRSSTNSAPQLLVGVGFLSSFTTFSTVMGDTVLLVQQGSLGIAALNLGASLALGVTAAALGFWAGHLV